jgi:hypothetical protein
MALLRAGRPAPNPDAEAPEVPDEIPRHKNPRDARPWIRKPDLEWRVTDPAAGRGDYYTRASSFGKVLENGFGLGLWRIRNVVWGLSRRPDYYDQAQAIASAEDGKALDEVAGKAEEYAKGSAGATSGTALHVLSERKDRGEDLAYLGPRMWDALEIWRELTQHFVTHASELFVVWDAHRVAGTLDRLWSLARGYGMVAPDGTVFSGADRLVGDLKSGKSATKFGPCYALQQKPYANGVPYTHRSGRGEWPGGIAPSTSWALIPHVPLDTPDDAALWWVDLRPAVDLPADPCLADVASFVRKLASRKDLFTKADPPRRMELAPITELGLLALIRDACDEAALIRIYEIHKAHWTDACTNKVRSRIEEWKAS